MREFLIKNITLLPYEKSSRLLKFICSPTAWVFFPFFKKIKFKFSGGAHSESSMNS